MKKLLVVVLAVLFGFIPKAQAADLIKVDGSSTVFPVTEAVAEEFGAAGKGKVIVGISGTGGGFKRFCRGETDISNASRPIKDTEAALCKSNGVEFIEIPVTYDGLAVIVNPKNYWVDHLTVAELKKIWDAPSQDVVTNWNQIRSSFPDKPLSLYGPGTDSGTFDYFTEVVNGKAQKSRGDYTASEDDNVLVEGVSSDEGGIGYFGVAYYEANKDSLKLVPVDGGNGPEIPTMETVRNGTYQPLSRPLFIYVSKPALKKNPKLKSFVEFYIENAEVLSEEVGYIPLLAEDYEKIAADFKNSVI